MRGSRSRAKARGRQSALVVKVKRGVTRRGNPMWMCILGRGATPAWVFEDELDTVWAGTKYADLFRGMPEDEWLSFLKEPIEVLVESNHAGFLTIMAVDVDFAIEGYLHAARHASALSKLLAGDRQLDEAVGAEEGGRLHCWGLVARIYREIHFTLLRDNGEADLAELIEYIWDGIDGGIPNNALIAIVNAVYANYLECGGHLFSFMAADEEIWGHALDKSEGAGAEGRLIEFLDWDAIELADPANPRFYSFPGGELADFHPAPSLPLKLFQNQNLYSCADMKRLRLTRIVRDAKISPKRLQMTFSILLCSCGATAHTAKAVTFLPVITC